MATQATTPITALQELLAAHAARIEGYQHLQSQTDEHAPAGQLKDKIQLSQRQVSQLMEELAAYGDAAQSEVNRDTPLHKIWSDITAGQSPTNQTTLASAEEALEEKYRSVLRESNDLPESVEQLLQKQLVALSNSNIAV